MNPKHLKKTHRSTAKTRKEKPVRPLPTTHWLDSVLEPSWAWRMLYRT